MTYTGSTIIWHFFILLLVYRIKLFYKTYKLNSKNKWCWMETRVEQSGWCIALQSDNGSNQSVMSNGSLNPLHSHHALFVCFVDYVCQIWLFKVTCILNGKGYHFNYWSHMCNMLYWYLQSYLNFIFFRISPHALRLSFRAIYSSVIKIVQFIFK